jgi:hypothetical protein
MEFNLHTKYHITGSIGSLITAFKPKTKYRFPMATTLLFYNMQDSYLSFFKMYSHV